jgi:hypothetical protein
VYTKSVKKKLFRLSRQGQVPLYVAFFGVLVLCLGLAWFYLKNQSAFGQTFLSNLPFLQQPVSFSTQGWKNFSFPSQRVSVLYPPNWYTNDQGFISQYPYTPGITSNDVYNAINIQQVTFQIQVSYLNADWVTRLYNSKNEEIVANDYRPTEQNKYTKIDSGQTFQGKKFVMFQGLGEKNQMHAYLLVNTDLIFQFNLFNYDQTGVGYFKQIITTATVN